MYYFISASGGIFAPEKVILVWDSVNKYVDK